MKEFLRLQLHKFANWLWLKTHIMTATEVAILHEHTRLGMYGEMPKVTVGKIELCMFTDKLEEKRLWMQLSDGEGTEINNRKGLIELEKLLIKYFWKVF
jgi:hypothetical protein